jgi:hypothetical protein
MQYIKSANDYQAEPAGHSQYIYSEQGNGWPGGRVTLQKGTNL